MYTDLLLDAMGEINDSVLLEAKTGVQRIVRFPVKRALAPIIAAVLCLIFSVPALAAAGVDAAYDLLYEVSPGLAAMIGPVRLSCESNGIQLSVVSVDVHADPEDRYLQIADITFLVKDLKGDQIDETTDLFDAGSFFAPFDSGTSTTFTDFDHETGELRTVRSVYQLTEKANYDSELYSFHISRILGGKERWAGMIPASVLTDVDTDPLILTQGELELLSRDSSAILMRPCAEPLFQPIEHGAVTAVGYTDGALHVQVKPGEVDRGDDTIYILLQKPDGTFLPWDEAITFLTYGEGYVEYIFRISYDDLAGCKLHGDFICYNIVTEGNWKLTFRLRDLPQV